MPGSAAAISESIAAVTSVPGAVEAVANAPRTVSNFFVLGTKLIHGTAYLSAFVIVFPAALIFAAIPKGNALVQGLIEGTEAAHARAAMLVG